MFLSSTGHLRTVLRRPGHPLYLTSHLGNIRSINESEMNLTFYLFAEWLKMNDEEILELQMAEVELLEAAYENELDFETKEVCLFFCPSFQLIFRGR